jgi:hypothetical protein
MSWIQTHNGGRFDFFNMSKHPLDIEAIAHALSQVCRFGRVGQIVPVPKTPSMKAKYEQAAD